MILPRTGRAPKSDDPTTNDQVLWERAPPTDQPLPTLCASYSAQHLLAPRHVQTRGLFTFLRRTANGFEFFDPGHFCSLFGTQSHVVLPTKVSEAFRIVGNAISVPQAVLSLGVACCWPTVGGPIALGPKELGQGARLIIRSFLSTKVSFT